MIKETLLELTQDLNALSDEHDTLMRIDWENRNIILSQIPGRILVGNRFWILIDNPKDRGSDIQVISNNKLKALKQMLLEVLNNYGDYQIIPGEYGFRVIAYKEILFKNQMTNLWTNIGEFDFRFSRIGKLILKMKSRDYRLLYDSLKSVKLS